MVAGLLDRVTGGGGAAALTVPQVTLEAGGGAAGGGLGAAVGNLLGGGTGAEPLGTRVLSLRLTRGLLPMLDLAEIQLAPAHGGEALPGLEAALALGLRAGEATAQFAATVAERELRPAGAGRLVLSNGGARLARLRVNECHTDRKPGDIVADLAGRLGIDTAGVKGEALPRCLLDAATPGHLLVARLAAMAGAVAAFDDAGTLRLIDDTAQGKTVAELEAGVNLLDWHLTTRRAVTGALSVDGAGVEGSTRWAWLRKEPGPMRTTTGTGDPVRAVAAPALRCPAGVEALAGALARSATRSAARARFLATGLPAVVPGAMVALAGLPEGDGNWFVTAVTHRFDLAHGLVTEIAAAPVGGGGAGGMLGGLL
jgi:hypothetical protein